ncbi:hypothetical protein HDU98_001438 [Podochytrium sp. JEL0797]|nr:hypothetical protein HDU98_001438 [Podochytrium sp. JEL0797]
MSTVACHTPFVAGTVYNGGSQVSYQGANYLAKWWESGSTSPDQQGDGGWSSQGACGSVADPSANAAATATSVPVGVPCSPSWDATLNYVGQSAVSFKNVNYVNSWWENPGADPLANADGGWVSKGACGTATPVASTSVPAVSSAAVATTVAVTPAPSATTTALAPVASTTSAVLVQVSTTPATTTDAPIATSSSATAAQIFTSASTTAAAVPTSAAIVTSVPVSSTATTAAAVPSTTTTAAAVASSATTTSTPAATSASTTAAAPVLTSATTTSTTTPVMTSTSTTSSAIVTSAAVATTTKSVAPVTSTTASTSTSTSAAATATGTPLPDCYPNWTATPFASIAYNGGNLVSYNGNNYVVTYQGAAGPPNAGAGTGWTLQGPCAGNGFTYRPFTTPGVIGYWTQWSPYSRKQNSIDQINLAGFNAINYAFVNVDATGTLQTFDQNADLNWMRTFTAQRLKYPNLRAIVSIGGWSGSMHFSTVAASASLTQTFVKNVHTFLDTMGFDGVDLDWEYPGGSGISCNTISTSDAANYVSLLSALRTELGPTRSISIAASAETSHYADPATGTSYIPQYMKYINYAQLMSYDFYGSWDAYSDFNSPLNSPGPSDPQQPSQNNAGYPVPLSQAAAVALWVKAGAPTAQLTNGLAFYGRSWSVPSTTNNGLYQLCQGSTQDPKTGLYSACTGPVGDFLDITQWCDPCKTCYNSGVWMYLNMRGAAGQTSPPLPSSATVAGNGWTRQYFDFAQSPTVQTSSNYRSLPSFISYDDPVSIKAKAAWAKSSGLGGTMIWELSQDYNAELVTAVHAGWGA